MLIKKILFVLPLVFVLFSSPIFAQTSDEEVTPTPIVPDEAPPSGINLTLSPTFLNLVAEPGGEATSQIKIQNNNNFTEYLRMDTAKFEAAEGGARPLISEFTSEDEYREWISFSEDQFTLDPNETKVIDVTITPPEEASLGYYYAIIVNRTSEAEEVEFGASVAGAPAVLALLEVRSGDAIRELQLVDFKTSKLFYEYLPTEFEITVKNTGNIHLVPSGDIFIDSFASDNVATIRANEGRGNVLPDTERTYTASWDDAFAVRVPKEENGQVVTDENGNTVYTTEFDFTKANKFRMGKYTANVLLVYDNGERDIPLEAQVSFWVVPWKILIVTGVILLFAFLGLRNTILSGVRRFTGKK